MLDFDRVNALLRYDPETGKLFWKVPRGRMPSGVVAGRLSNKGYIQIGIDNKRYSAHRLAWLLFYGVWPKQLIDHINLNRSDNRISNLREATNSENQHNRTYQRGNTSGFKGVTRRKGDGKWIAYIGLKGVRHHIGCFNSAIEAHKAYVKAAKEKHGSFARSSNAE